MWCDRAGAHLHYSIYKTQGIETSGAATHTHTHTHNPLCEYGDGRLLWSQETDFTANRTDIIIKHRKEKHVY
jgi:hypothetical protein